MPETLKEIRPGSNGPDLFSRKFSRRDLLRVTAGIGAGIAAKAMAPAVPVLDSLSTVFAASPEGGGGGGADLLPRLEDKLRLNPELYKKLAESTQFDVEVTDDVIHAWSGPGIGKKFDDIEVLKGDTIRAYARTNTGWTFGVAEIKDKDGKSKFEWGFYSGNKDFGKLLSIKDGHELTPEEVQQLTTLTDNDIPVLQKALWPDLPTEPAKPKEKAKTGLLEVKGPQLEIDGIPIVVEGAVFPHLLWKRIVIGNNHLERLKQNARTLKNWGGSWAVLDWNSGQSDFLDDALYRRHIALACQYVHETLGLPVLLNLHSRGIENETNYYGNIRITSVDPQLVTDWQTLLSDHDVASALAKYVDMFCPLSEPEGISMQDAMYHYQKVKETIGNAIGRQPTCLYSIPNGNIGQMFAMDLKQFEGSALGIHPYATAGLWGDSTKQGIVELKKQGICIIADEIGWVDSPDVISDQTSFFKQNGISWAAWAMVDSPDRQTDRLLFPGDVPTPLGELIKGTLST